MGIWGPSWEVLGPMKGVKRETSVICFTWVKALCDHCVGCFLCCVGEFGCGAWKPESGERQVVSCSLVPCHAHGTSCLAPACEHPWVCPSPHQVLSYAWLTGFLMAAFTLGSWQGLCPVGSGLPFKSIDLLSISLFRAGEGRNWFHQLWRSEGTLSCQVTPYLACPLWKATGPAEMLGGKCSMGYLFEFLQCILKPQ